MAYSEQWSCSKTFNFYEISFAACSLHLYSTLGEISTAIESMAESESYIKKEKSKSTCWLSLESTVGNLTKSSCVGWMKYFANFARFSSRSREWNAQKNWFICSIAQKVKRAKPIMKGTQKKRKAKKIKEVVTAKISSHFVEIWDSPTIRNSNNLFVERWNDKRNEKKKPKNFSSPQNLFLFSGLGVCAMCVFFADVERCTLRYASRHTVRKCLAWISWLVFRLPT